MSEGEYLLINNKINISQSEVKNKNDLKEDTKSVIIQKPNHKLFGIGRYKLWNYNRVKKKIEMGKSVPEKQVGEPPVLYDSLSANKTITNIEKYLTNVGYFESQASHSLIKKKKKKVIIEYQVDLGKPFLIKQVSYSIDDNAIASVLDKNKANSYLKINECYNVDKIKKERDRITTTLKNAGYYRFNREFVVFEVDTLDSHYDLSLDVVVKNPGQEAKHKVYTVKDIFIYSDNDTVLSTLDTLVVDSFYKIVRSGLRYKPEILIDNIYLEKDDNYSLRKHLYTISTLSNLYAFKYVSMKFEPDDLQQTLRGSLYLTPEKLNDIQFEIEASNTDLQQTLGSAAKLSYNRRNLLKLADLLTLNIRGGVEFLFANGESGLFSSNVSLSGDWYVPKFVTPIKLKGLSKYFNPTTHFSTNYNFYTRTGFYTMNNTSFSINYDWKEDVQKRHVVTPLTATFTKLANTTFEFQQRLQGDNVLRNSFRNQLIIGSGYTFLFNNQNASKRKNFINFQNDIQIAGNLLRLANNLLYDVNPDDISYTFLDVAFSQFVRIKSDLRYYQILSKEKTMVYRLLGGIGVPYGNSVVMPYIKQFFAGGPNSIRAWRVRSLGPGAYAPPADANNNGFLDQTGDIIIEANMEYRFPIAGVLKGAAFVDAGNIWTLREDTIRPGAQFEVNDFLREFAIGTGFGLRFDFDFLVLRLDMSVPFIDPSYPEGDRLYINKVDLRNDIVYNLAIGFPF